MPILDLTGQVFGRLTVIEKSNIRKSNRVSWRCKCLCGNETIVITNHLTSGHTRSCGCLQKQVSGQMNPAIDISNQRFGKLIAIERAQRKEQGHTYWKCQCDCGNICEVRTNSLRTGHTTSCGCINSKGEEQIANWLKNHNIKFERQKIFKDCRNTNTNYPLRFDFFIENKFLLEYDGITHFQATAGWNTTRAVENMSQRDNIKNAWAEEKQIPLYRINYNEIYSENVLNNTLSKILLKEKIECED